MRLINANFAIVLVNGLGLVASGPVVERVNPGDGGGADESNESPAPDRRLSTCRSFS